MVKKEDVEQLMLQQLPQCPLCKAKNGYKVSGLFKNYVQCNSCKAQWLSTDFVTCKELNVLTLFKLSRNGHGKQFRNKECPITLWKNMMNANTYSEFLQRIEEDKKKEDEDKKIGQLLYDLQIQSFGRQLGGKLFTSERAKKDVIQKLEEVARSYGQTFFEYITERRPEFGAGFPLVLMGDERGIEPLFNLLKKGVGSAESRKHAVNALLLFEKANKTGKTIDPIIWVLHNDNDAGVRVHTASVLGELKDYSKVIDALIQALSDIGVLNIGQKDFITGSENWEVATVTLTVIKALKNIGDERGLTAAVNYSLSHLKPNHLINFSLRAANWFRQNAVTGLEQLGWNPANDSNAIYYWAAKNQWDKIETLGESAVEPLIHILTDPDEKIRNKAVEILRKIGDARGLEAIEPAEKLRKTIDEKISKRDLTARVLYYLHDLKSQSWETRKQAVETLGDIKATEAVPSLILSLKDEHYQVRVKAVQALGKIKDIKAFESLIQALNDESIDVRQNAANALGDIGDFRAVEALTQAKEDKSWWVRSAAKGALKKIQNK